MGEDPRCLTTLCSRYCHLGGPATTTSALDPWEGVSLCAGVEGVELARESSRALLRSSSSSRTVKGCLTSDSRLFLPAPDHSSLSPCLLGVFAGVLSSGEENTVESRRWGRGRTGKAL